MAFNGRPPPAFSLGGFVTGGGFNPHMPGGVFVPATQVGIIPGTGPGGILTRAPPMQIRHRPTPPSGLPNPTEHINNTEVEENDSGAPKTTVFVGNISDKAPDVLIRQLLARCGSVLNWKRVQGASGNLQAFGFCEYREPENTLRAIRLLHELTLGDKNLLVKVDAKTRALLDSYLSEKNKKKGSEGSEDEIDEKTKMEDDRIMMDMNRLIIDYRAALTKPSRSSGGSTGFRSGSRPYGALPGDKSENAGNRDDSQQMRKAKDLRDEKIDDIEMEDDKKKIISREIDRFRLTHKDETEEGETKEPSEDKETRSRSTDRDRRRDVERMRERDRERDRERRRDRDREHREKEQRDRERDRLRRERENRERMEEEKERERERRQERERERAREREKMGSDGEDEYERRKLEKKLKEKEYAYQERLKNWVARERKKTRDHEKFKDKERNEKVEMDKDKRSLHDFLEDYDDDKQDIKYYKGAALEKRRDDREKELEMDMRDRRREAEEIHEIKRRLKEEGSENLLEELARLEQERDGHKKRLLENVDLTELLNRAKAQPKEEETIAIDDEEDDGEINDDVNDLEIDETGEIEDQPSEQLRVTPQPPADDPSREASKSRDHSRERSRDQSRERSRDQSRERSRDQSRERSRDLSRERSREASPKQPTRETFKKRSRKESRKLRRDQRRYEEEEEEEEGERREPTPEEAEPMDDISEPQEPSPDRQSDLKPAFEEVRQEEPSPVAPPEPIPEEIPKEAKRGMGFGGLKLGSSSSPTVASNGKSKRKKKMTVQQVFNQDEEGGDSGPKKRKLVPIDYSEEEKAAVREVQEQEEATSGGNVAEEKRKSIKTLIEKIPTEKSELFAYQLDWTVVDNSLMERRIRPWINKKIIEYIGEEEPTLTDFICTKLLEHSGPETILNDITMVLDEEAEVFVVKMWRLLIYEVEAKKHGLVK